MTPSPNRTLNHIAIVGLVLGAVLFALRHPALLRQPI